MTDAPERISDVDLERHKWLRDKLEAAQAELGKVLGAWHVWGEELHERYGLAKDGSEGIEPDGTIVRHDA